MNLNGELSIQLHLVSTVQKANQDDKANQGTASQGKQYCLNKLDINLARPNLAQKMLIGQTPENALERIKQLMTVCQHAQSAAAKLALGYSLTTAETLAIEYENIEQGFWRLVIDLPKLLEVELSLSTFIKLRQAIAKQPTQQSKAKIITLAEALFIELCHLTTHEFAHLSSVELQQWLNKNQSPMANCLRKVSQIMANEQGSQANLLSDKPNDELLTTIAKSLQSECGFHSKPNVAKQACETGSLAAMQNNPHFEWLATSGTVGRFMSRLLYLAQKIDGLSDGKAKDNTSGSFAIEQSEGIDEKGYTLGWVQTARGLLVHLANIQAGKISQYSIVAPTEWNFHPKSGLSKLFVSSRFNSVALAEKSVKVAILVLDPCIEFTLGVAHA